MLNSSSAGENFLKGRFFMVEFGEQLRNARELKGLTQKSLAEQLYVTRQTVSRWECGERYPDIITLKRLSEILSVSLDDLLSGKEMTEVAEKNPVVEDKTINNVTSVLYAFIVLSVFMQLAVEGALLYVRAYNRFEILPFGFASNLYNLERVIFIIIFTYGIYNAAKDSLTPKKIGIILFAYFLAHLLLYGGVRLYWDVPHYTETIKHAMDPGGEKYGVVTGDVGVLYQTLFRSIFRKLWTIIIPCVLGAIASYKFFIREGKRKLWVYMLTIASALRILDTAGMFIRRIIDERFYAMNYSSATFDEVASNVNDYIVDFVLGIALSVLVIYQAYTLYRKRRTAMDLIDAGQLVEAPAQ